jgi:hypothetical protein
MTPKFFLQISTPPKGTSSRNLRRLRHYGSGGYSCSGFRGPKELKKVNMRSWGNCIFRVYGEQTPLNRFVGTRKRAKVGLGPSAH